MQCIDKFFFRAMIQKWVVKQSARIGRKVVSLSRKEQYHQYLHSKTWQQSKARFLKVLKSRNQIPKCKICSSTENLHLHHKSYKRLGKERKGDLCFLCADCHAVVHELCNHTGLNWYNAPGHLRKVFVRLNDKGLFYDYIDFCIRNKKVPEKRLSSDCCAENNCSLCVNPAI